MHLYNSEYSSSVKAWVHSNSKNTRSGVSRSWLHNFRIVLDITTAKISICLARCWVTWTCLSLLQTEGGFGVIKGAPGLWYECHLLGLRFMRSMHSGFIFRNQGPHHCQHLASMTKHDAALGCWVKEGLGFVVHIPSGCVAKINIQRPWPLTGQSNHGNHSMIKIRCGRSRFSTTILEDGRSTTTAEIFKWSL